MPKRSSNRNQSIDHAIRERLAKVPTIPSNVFVADGARLDGEVFLGEHASVWFNAVLRGDIAPVFVGEATNIQDAAVLHTADDLPCRIGNLCTIGHSAIVHACTVGDECLIGMGAIVLDESVIGPQCIIGAGALVTQRTKIPEGSLVYGSSARVIRALSREERKGIRGWADRYVELARTHQFKT